jgi:hypothetical protein
MTKGKTELRWLWLYGDEIYGTAEQFWQCVIFGITVYEVLSVNIK